MATIADKALQDTIAELVGTTPEEGGPFVMRPFAKRLMESRLGPIMNKYFLLMKGTRDIQAIKDEGLQEKFKNEYTETQEAVINAIEQSEDFRDLRYQKSYERLKNANEEGIEGWGGLFTEIYQDDEALNEIFVRLVEEQEKVEITSVKQLQQLTGIKEIYGEWDEDKEETVPYHGNKRPTKKEAQKEAYKQLEETFTLAMEFRYRNLLEGMLKTGAKYKDLLSVEPGRFNLPAEKQEPVIKKTLALYYNLIEPSYFRPDLKTIAEEIGAPYGVLLEAANFWKSEGESNGDQ